MEYQKNNRSVVKYTELTMQIQDKNWAEKDDDLRETYNTNGLIKFKISMLKSSLYDYHYGYILIKGTTTTAGRAAGQAARQAEERDEEVMFKN